MNSNHFISKAVIVVVTTIIVGGAIGIAHHNTKAAPSNSMDTVTASAINDNNETITTNIETDAFKDYNFIYSYNTFLNDLSDAEISSAIIVSDGISKYPNGASVKDIGTYYELSDIEVKVTNFFNFDNIKSAGYITLDERKYYLGDMAHDLDDSYVYYASDDGIYFDDACYIVVDKTTNLAYVDEYDLPIEKRLPVNSVLVSEDCLINIPYFDNTTFTFKYISVPFNKYVTVNRLELNETHNLFGLQDDGRLLLLLSPEFDDNGIIINFYELTPA